MDLHREARALSVSPEKAQAEAAQSCPVREPSCTLPPRLFSWLQIQAHSRPHPNTASATRWGHSTGWVARRLWCECRRSLRPAQSEREKVLLAASRHFVLLVRERMTGNNLAGRTECHGLGEILFIDICQNLLTCKVHHMDKVSINPLATIIGILSHHRIVDPAVAKDIAQSAAGLKGIDGLVSPAVDEYIIL